MSDEGHPTRTPRTTSIERMIEDAFSDAVYPGDDRLVYDAHQHLECAQVRDAFRGKTWRDVPLEVLVEQHAAPSFFSPEAFRYYLPSYLLAVVKHFEEADLLPEVVVQYLTMPSSADNEKTLEFLRAQPEWKDADDIRDALEEIFTESATDDQSRLFLERMSPLSRAQGNAIKHFLQHLERHHGSEYPINEPRLALDRYWHIYT